ncbi:hypothetical protein POX_g08691 [Penicillium oxalicum]|uniref:hypothetical protein n=1 Tax=Penicillium oxalicum TaxID=69781 RepID=UPI0020B87A69|nr:hypothetical protein POX_g08691 [Penicillium oxalicum]KAI2786308.1 hypothetical protein POX_g08691 [Penicillium oxalicum]
MILVALDPHRVRRLITRDCRRKHDPHYMNELEIQVQLLKAEIRRLENLHPSMAVSESIAEIMTADDTISGTPVQADLEGDHGTNISTAINDVSSLLWRLKISEGGETSLIGPSGNFCFETDSAGVTINPVQPDFEHEHAWCEHGSDQNSLDVSQVVKNLVTLFTKFINPVHQLVDEDVLVEMADSPTADMTFLGMATLAAGSLYADSVEGKCYGSEMAAIVEATALKTCRETPTLSTIQALSIMCWRELALDNEKMAWMYNGMACSLALHLGLTVSSLETLQTNESEASNPQALQSRQLRVKSLWSVILLDRIATSLLGRNCLIPWRRVSAPFYLDVVDQDVPLQAVIFDYHCRLWFIHDQFMDSIYSFQFLDLDMEKRHGMLIDARERLLSFRRDLNSRLRLTKDVTEPTLIFCHMSYHMSQLLIHRPYLNEPPGSHIHRLSIRSMAVEAAEIVRLIRAYERLAHFDKAPPFIVHSVQTAAITLLLNATSTEPSLKSQSISRFRVCFNALEAMSSRWQRARNAMTVLRELAHRWNIIKALPIRYSVPVSMERQSKLTTESELACSCETGSLKLQSSALDDVEVVDAGFDWASLDYFDYSGFDPWDLGLDTLDFWV